MATKTKKKILTLGRLVERMQKDAVGFRWVSGGSACNYWMDRICFTCYLDDGTVPSFLQDFDDNEAEFVRLDVDSGVYEVPIGTKVKVEGNEVIFKDGRRVHRMTFFSGKPMKVG